MYTRNSPQNQGIPAMRQIAVIGLGKFGSAVALELMEQGAQVIAVDRDERRVEALKDAVTYAVTLDATDEEALRSVSVNDVDAAVVCVGVNVEANLLTTLLLKQIGVDRIWARAINPLQQTILQALDVDSVINLEDEMGRVVARSLVTENVIRHVHLSEGYSVVEMNVPPSFVGKTLRQSRIRDKHQLNVVAIKHQRQKPTDEGEEAAETYTENVPSPDGELAENDVLVVVGKDSDIAAFSKRD